MDIKRGIDSAVGTVVEQAAGAEREVSDSDEVRQVGTISANGDAEIGAIIAKAMDRGVARVRSPSKRLRARPATYVDGMQFDRRLHQPLLRDRPRAHGGGPR